MGDADTAAPGLRVQAMIVFHSLTIVNIVDDVDVD